MARAQLTFRQGDVTRAIRAVEAAGAHVGRIEIDKDGKIVIVTGLPANGNQLGGEPDEWADVLR
jgi:hypothetical protein